MRAPLTCSFLCESEYEEWQLLVESSDQGSVYGNPVFLDALCRAAGGTFKILAVRRADKLVGGIALYENSNQTPPRVSPRPLLYYNGITLERPQSKYPSQQTARQIEVGTALESVLSNCGYRSITVRNRSTYTDCRAFIAKGWSVRPSYTYVVRIADLPAAWDRMEQNLRRLVKRCAGSSYNVTEDDDFDSFLRLHCESMERKGRDQYLPDAAFRQLFADLHANGLCQLYQVRLPDGRAISSQLVWLGRHSVSHTVAAAADERYLNTGATAFLRWKVFEALSALGYSANDLTDAALNSVTHFKSQLGGNLETCLVMEKKDPSLVGWKRRLRAAIAGRFTQ